MAVSRIARWVWSGILLVGVAGFGQQAPTSDSQLPDAPQQQPQAQPSPPPPSDQPAKEEKKPESKIKKTLKRGKPNCIKIVGMEKCKESGGDEEDANEGQQTPQPPVPQSQPLPRSTPDPNVSSSKETDVPTGLEREGGSGAPSDVRELHPYDPHRADKDVEVGDFYFKRGNLRAAESRYAEALDFMPHHAVAMFKLAETEAKLGKAAQAREHYQGYLKILPQGEFAKAAREALARLDTQSKAPTSPPAQNPR